MGIHNPQVIWGFLKVRGTILGVPTFGSILGFPLFKETTIYSPIPTNPPSKMISIFQLQRHTEHGLGPCPRNNLLVVSSRE